MRTLILLVIFFPLFGLAQESNMKTAISFGSILENNHTPKYLYFDIHKNGEDENQYSVVGYIEIYNDSLIYNKFWETPNGKINRRIKKITDPKTIKYVNYYYSAFYKYEPRCYHYSKFMCSSGFSSKSRKFHIRYARNEWSVMGAKLNKTGNYEYTYSFKSRLFRFDCLGFFKNLKSRHMFRKLIRLLENSK